MVPLPPLRGGSSVVRTPADAARRDPWTVLESLLHSLSDANDASKSIQATVDAACECIEADAAFWYSKSVDKVLAVSGNRELDLEWCRYLGQTVVARIPEGDDVLIWNAPAQSPEEAAYGVLVCRSRKTHGCIVAISFDPARPFVESDGKVARVSLKMLLAQRAQSQAGTKQLLLGLLHSLTTIIDAKDPFTAGHSERVGRIASLIAKQMHLGVAQVGDVFLASLLHDVGNIGIRDEVLQKPGKLSREEYEEIQVHPTISDRIVASIKPFERLRGAVRHHHERYDGSGYPDKLKGDDIPLLARVLAVADAIDAMMSPRRYRPNRSPVDIDAELSKQSGGQFDPLVVRAFFAIRHEVYPPIYQKGIGESAFHAIENIVENLSDTGGTRPALPAQVKRPK